MKQRTASARTWLAALLATLAMTAAGSAVATSADQYQSLVDAATPATRI